MTDLDSRVGELKAIYVKCVKLKHGRVDFVIDVQVGDDVDHFPVERMREGQIYKLTVTGKEQSNG
jgi:hypothetical protein